MAPAAPVRPNVIAPCHSAVKTPPKTPLLPTSTASTNTIAAVAAPGTTAKRHGWLRAQRAARLALCRMTTLPPATVNAATVPADSEVAQREMPADEVEQEVSAGHDHAGPSCERPRARRPSLRWRR